MSGKKPTLTDAGRAEAEARRAREAAALRENLRKRKAQARARKHLGPSSAAGQPSPRDPQGEA